MIQSGIPILGFVARSNTGKTTLLVRILPLLTDRGWRVAMVKHAPHGFDIDRPGKDSFKLRKAGATQTLRLAETMAAHDRGKQPPWIK